MTEKTFTLTLTADEIISIGFALNKLSAELAFNRAGDFDKIIPMRWQEVDTLSKKVWAEYDK